MRSSTITTTPGRLAVELVGLQKSFGGQVALDGVDLAVAEGTVLALVGPNGSGKTTTVRILSTLLLPDGGRATVSGHDVAAAPGRVRRLIGVTGQFSAVDNLLTCRENLALMADLHHLGRAAGGAAVEALLDRFELTEAAAKPALVLSGGQRRRLDLAMALIGQPRIIFLDEPTTGLDPRSRRVLWQIVRQLVSGGVTVLLTTQYLEEADELADQVAVIDRGRIVAQGTPAELKRRVPGGFVRLEFESDELVGAAATLLGGAGGFGGLGGVDRCDGRTLQLATDGSAGAVRRVLELLAVHGVAPLALTVQPPSLDDVFLALTGHAADRVEVAS